MKQVKIYTTPTCVYCNMAKKFFQEKGVKYEEYNVASDLEKRKEMVELTGQMGVPVIAVGNDAIIGFNQAKLEELLEIK